MELNQKKAVDFEKKTKTTCILDKRGIRGFVYATIDNVHATLNTKSKNMTSIDR